MTDLEQLSALLRREVRDAVHPRRADLAITARSIHGEPVPAREVVGTGDGRVFEAFAVGDAWGGRWDTAWFRFRGRVPDEWAGGEVVALVHLGGDEIVGFSAEGLVWTPDARAVQGLHHRHRDFLIHEKAEGGEEVDFYVEAAANPIPPWHLKDWPLLGPDYHGEPLYRLAQAELATVDQAARALYFDLRVVLQLARVAGAGAGDPGPGGPVATAAIEAATAAADAFSAGDLTAARAALEPVLARRSSSVHTVTAVGHAHIDSAWLWPVRETKRKCARSFSNQLRLMERYAEHRFACSQAAQYEWMKDGYPEIFEAIRAQVRAGRWTPVGGMWVEPDTNVPSGESLVRQLVHGKRFFAEEFGVETHELWIPDVFGYSAALPQIAAQAGVTALITQKMSWNDTNVFPRSTFWWEGHDGSRILAHFPPANTYNGEFSVAELESSQVNFKDHDRSHFSLYPFGYGDGGGGPTAEMLESARRLADLDGVPKVGIGTVEEFLEAVRREDGALATWVGELYLEFHRATPTTHADVKLANRRGEEALRAAEMWSVAAGLDRRVELDRAWKTLLFQQFHDILPGSSIHWVYEDTARDHASVLSAATAIRVEAESALVGPSGPEAFTVFNDSSYDRSEVVDVPGRGLAMVSVPGCGWGALDVAGLGGGGPRSVRAGEGFMENEHLRVTWDRDGLLTSVWDTVAAREVLAAGERGNVLQLHEDHPKAFDAWDVDRSYLDSVEPISAVESIEVVESDPLRCGVRMVRRFGNSAVEQVMRLSAGSRRLEFHTEVEWHELHRFLKVAFPVAVRSARATYEIQHGHIERPTVANTSWDEARFEVCAHRWADLSEPGYGVALLNDCKYGYDIRGHVMRLSLLRGPGFPDPEADQGRHRFVYALLPHAGDLRSDGRVVEEAESLNLPLRVVAGSGVTGSGGAGRVVEVDRRGVSVEAVKLADRGDGVVVRLCEVWGQRGPVKVTVPFSFGSVVRTDLLERDVEPVAPGGSSVVLHLRPFELVTLRFDRRS